MLCQFTFENFKSFKRQAFLDFCAEPISDNIGSLIIDTDKESFLPIVSIYGPNGGGKSTVLEALHFLVLTVGRFFVAAKLGDKLSQSNLSVLNKPINEKNFHIFDKSCETKPISFEIAFRTKGYEYRYELSILQEVIVKENLYYKKIGHKNATVVFERTQDECAIGKDIEFVAVGKIKNSLPLLSYIATSYDVEAVDNVMSWLLSIRFLDYNNSAQEKQFVFSTQEDKRKELFDMLNEMDINISDFRIEKELDGTIKNIFTRRNVNGTVIELPIQEESSGTRKILSCLLNITNCLDNGRLLLADELDAKLHPKLMRFIIDLFTDPQKNPNGAQLLLTSHDIINMTPDVFRRDEIWFCALSPDNDSTLYSLISFKEENGKQPRKDAVYGKRYLEGKYGADPYIKKGFNWGEKL